MKSNSDMNGNPNSSTPSAPKKKKKGISAKTAIIITVSVMVFLLVAILGGGYLLLDRYASLVNHDDGSGFATGTVNDDTDVDEDSPDDVIQNANDRLNNDNLPIITHDENILNILCIGTDARSMNEVARSDSMILISINQKTKKIVATSILRDIYVNIEGHQPNRLNVTHALGGPKLLISTIKDSFNITIDYYVSVNFYSFIKIIDQLGGFDFEVSAAEIDIMNRYYLAELNELMDEPKGTDYIKASQAGMLHMNGKQALAYARNRYVGAGDFDRAQRQRNVLSTMLDKIKDLNFVELDNLLVELLPNVTTDMSKDTIKSLISKSFSYLKYEFVQSTIPQPNTYEYVNIRKMSVTSIDFEENIKYLDNLIHN